jgi:DNA mismatch repair protein MutL
MKKDFNLKKLSEEVVNQIAAGEVIERPASVVKELVDNSIDANATEITLRIRDGGISLIEVSDDGLGIPKDKLADVFTAHTTSKLESLEDLNNLLSMGFRGEALSTIVAVSDLSMISKYEDDDIAGEIVFKKSTDYKVKSAAREKGTVVRVENIFGNIPARKKFLKTAQTEYRNILNTLTPSFLIYPNIKWGLIKDGKVVYNLKRTEMKAGRIDKHRVTEVVGKDFVERMETVFFNGNGMKISGLVAHPSDHFSRTKYQYIYVNRRNVWDNGIAKAVLQAYDRYIPHKEKVPFFINIEIKPELVDINIHPRKEEVRFLNPYRVYSSVEQAVQKSIEKLVSFKNISKDDKGQPKSLDYSNDYTKQKNINFSRGGSVRDSLNFSKAALEQNYHTPIWNTKEENDKDSFLDSNEEAKSFYQIFNKYIIIEFDSSIWIIDQHAAAERITFEKLLKNTEIKNTDTQNMLVPVKINIDKASKEFIKENSILFCDIGFKIEIEKDTLIIKSIPVEFINADIERLIEDVLESDIEDIKKDVKRLKENLIATMACHTSVRSGQKLQVPLMKDLFYNLLDCDNPYSCPHGRPIVWRMSIEELDSKFDRTY